MLSLQKTLPPPQLLEKDKCSKFLRLLPRETENGVPFRKKVSSQPASQPSGQLGIRRGKAAAVPMTTPTPPPPPGAAASSDRKTLRPVLRLRNRRRTQPTYPSVPRSKRTNGMGREPSLRCVAFCRKDSNRHQTLPPPLKKRKGGRKRGQPPAKASSK